MLFPTVPASTMPTPTGSLHGPGLQALYRQKYLPSGAPANDDRVTTVILHGHDLMPAFSGSLDKAARLNDLLAYLHTLSPGTI